MGNEQNRNEHAAPTPESTAATNAAIAAAVREAVSGVMATLAPVLQQATDPERLVAVLREANKPYQDPAKVARELRESLKWKTDEAEARRIDEERRARCPHLDKRGQTSINLVHNFYDHQPRGICVICGDWIYPREWRIASTPEIALKLVGGDKDRVKGCAYMSDAHKNYATVVALESMS